MTSKAVLNTTDLSATQKMTRQAAVVLNRKIWLPTLIYDALPYFYLTASFASFFATLYISDWFWILPHCLLASAVICQFAFSIINKRRAQPLD